MATNLIKVDLVKTNFNFSKSDKFVKLGSKIVAFSINSNLVSSYKWQLNRTWPSSSTLLQKGHFRSSTLKCSYRPVSIRIGATQYNARLREFLPSWCYSVVYCKVNTHWLFVVFWITLERKTCCKIHRTDEMNKHALNKLRNYEYHILERSGRSDLACICSIPIPSEQWIILAFSFFE